MGKRIYHTEAERLAAQHASKRRYLASPKGKAKRAEWLKLPHVKAKKREGLNRWLRAHPEIVAERNRNASWKRARRDPTALANRELMAGEKRPDICDACGNPAGKKGLHFDHCHTNGWFRGWLCSPCNTSLGLLQDDPNRLRKLISYLERTANGRGSQLALSGI